MKSYIILRRRSWRHAIQQKRDTGLSIKDNNFETDIVFQTEIYRPKDSRNRAWKLNVENLNTEETNNPFVINYENLKGNFDLRKQISKKPKSTRSSL